MAAALRAALLWVPLAAAAQGLAAPAVRLQEDPFRRLQRVEAGAMASSWSSLPDTAGCADADRRIDGHAQLQASDPDVARTVRTGSFDLIDPRLRAQADATLQWGCAFGQAAVQYQLGNRDGDAFWSADGSALAWQIGAHWRLAGGLIAHHWGPAWDGSLILGTRARPFPNLLLEADSGPLQDSRFWFWLGRVQFSSFLGVLNGDRGDIRDPRLIGMRLVVQPWPQLQIGASRTMQIGGEGRDNSLRAFLRAFLGRDNDCSASNCSDQPGNQLGGFDLRWDLSWALPGVSLYGQLIGEDEAASLPSKYMYQAGADWRGPLGVLFAEWADTKAGAYGVAYNHFIYTDGYRHRGQPIGHWTDGDAQVATIGGLASSLFGGQGLAVVRFGKLNNAQANPTWPKSDLWSGSLQWRTELGRQVRLSVALDHLRLSAQPPGASRSDTRLQLQIEGWLP
ncbi:MAG: hypothetical protein J0L57_07060 [Burkholderiales bacterium]|nr:hypothetical protein [Burkholderiales bacterium]